MGGDLDVSVLRMGRKWVVGPCQVGGDLDEDDLLLRAAEVS